MQRYFSTPITELFGIQHPILCGGLMWLADARYVAAVVNAGAMGFITPRSFPSLDDFRMQLQLANRLTDGKPFGVNLYISGQRDRNESLENWIDISLQEGVRHFETAGYSPARWLPRLRKADAVVIHKCTTIRHALRAEKDGVDAISLVGAECGGHPGSAITSAFSLGALANQQLSIPFVIGGGIGTGQQLLSALALGANGVLIGSRMLVSEEIWAHPKYKEYLLTLDENSTRTVLEPFRKTYRCLNNQTAEQVAALEQEGERDFDLYRPLVKGRKAFDAYKSGDYSQGILSLGPAIAFAHRIEPVEKIIQSLLTEALTAHQVLQDTMRKT
ncbi:MAG: nitronate monooxygenase [Myxococcota bacterium]|nr:nitronate monooxygenase [Myxococcota bacterium]